MEGLQLFVVSACRSPGLSSTLSSVDLASLPSPPQNLYAPTSMGLILDSWSGNCSQWYEIKWIYPLKFACWKMCAETEICLDKSTVLSFLVPFVLGGLFFSFVALNHLSHLPSQIVGILDQAYGVWLGFANMGSACGVIGLASYSIFKKIRPYLLKRRKIES